MINVEMMFYLIYHISFPAMAPKAIKKSSKKSSKGTSTHSTLTFYEKKIEEWANIVNTLTLIPLSSDTYVLRPIRKTLKGVDSFPYITLEEQLLLRK